MQTPTWNWDDIMLIKINSRKPEDLPEKIQLQDPETEVTENEKCQLHVVDVTVISRRLAKCRFLDFVPMLSVQVENRRIFDEDGRVRVVLGTHHLRKPANKIMENDGSVRVNQLRVVDVTVISQKACKVQIPGLRANAICTGGKQTTDKGGFCERDAGGPLVCKAKAVGIATVNDKCSFPGLPNVYIDISKYRSWIGNKIYQKKFNFKTLKRKNEKCHFAGWGPVENDGSVRVDQLHVVDVTVISPKACKVRFLDFVPMLSVQVENRQQTREDFVRCGGPLVCKGKAVGIATVNDNCSFQVYPTSTLYLKIPFLDQRCIQAKNVVKLLGSKIINGTDADDDLMKYMEDDEHICGGFLVSRHFVVTHGGDEDGKVMVVLGTHDLSNPRNQIKRHIISTCKPPPGIGTDIMLIKIYRTKPDDLPEEIQLQDPKTDNNGSDHVDQLRVVDVTVISPKACKDQIPGLRANAICTGGKQTTDNGGFCESDAGGPLVCKGKAVGIATVDDKCSFPGLPNVYIDISKYRSWIDKVLNVLGSKIINGKIADDDLMKYMVSVQKDDDHICGGFLVSKQFVVTHGGDEDGMVVLGTHHLSKPRNKIKEHINPHANPHLELGMTSCSLKKPEDLPEKIQLQDPETEVTENEKCQVAGWGPVQNNGIDPVDQLHVVDVTVISRRLAKCRFLDFVPMLSVQVENREDFVRCGWTPRVQGKAVGIATVNDKLLPGLPNVYIDISKYRSWIGNVLNGKIDCKIDEKGKIFVVLSTHDLTQPGSKIKEHIKSTCKPPPGIGTDIMLIEINSRNPEKLPEKIQLQDPETENEKCHFAGWGPVENDGSVRVDQLHVVDVTVISQKACKDQIPGLRANAICTGGNQTTDNGGFCKRDAGGPLVCKGKAVGIATVNDNCSFTADGSRIMKGAIAPDDTYEFLVSLQSNKKHVCGGFLISEDFVLTAAHCST
ncbi:hypothetical protein F7725_027523 [Dissostichus mawsoni]|uniref:Peptidase S1 domain-containing protein n=1 Tax=Dissostichus mawsoni TaxID=36200 RepID=A0A7J5XD57_DISMA|nr:hypothetical protein F7725_027523 [Dissostichus mawsoni]